LLGNRRPYCLHPKATITCDITITSGTSPKYLHCKLQPNRCKIATWLLLTAYRNLQTAYPTVPSPTDTTYCSATVHNVTDRQTTERNKSLTSRKDIKGRTRTATLTFSVLAAFAMVSRKYCTALAKQQTTKIFYKIHFVQIKPASALHLAIRCA